MLAISALSRDARLRIGMRCKSETRFSLMIAPFGDPCDSKRLRMRELAHRRDADVPVYGTRKSHRRAGHRWRTGS